MEYAVVVSGREFQKAQSDDLMQHSDAAIRHMMLPMVTMYHSGARKGAADLFISRPDLLAWTRGEIQRLRDVPMRGQPPQHDFVSQAHLKAYERMIAEFEEQQKT